MNQNKLISNNYILLICSVIIVLFISEIFFRYYENNLLKSDVQWSKKSNISQLFGRNINDLISVEFFNGCFMDNGIMQEHPSLGYVNISNVDGYSIRVYGKNNFVVKKPFDLSFFESKGLRIEAAPFHINNLGNRGNDMSLVKPPGIFRVVFFGDSITFGYYVEENDTFVARVGREIPSMLSPECKVEVINAGVSSLNARDIFNHIKEKAIPWSSDMVFWSFYVNDIFDLEGDVLFPVRCLGWMSFLRYTALGRAVGSIIFSSKLGANLGIDYKNPTNLLVENGWRSVEQDLASTQQLLRAHNIPLVVLIFPSAIQISRTWTRPHYQLRLRNLCEKYNIPYVDLLPAFEKTAKADELYFSGDSIHPNAYSHLITASEIMCFLKKNPGIFKRMSR
jgi:lysophospholipase L1-like esterase